jgi:hypothetical protein
MIVFPTPDGIDSTTLIPDNSKEPIGVVAPSTSVILKRVLQRKGADVPVAAFQSSI